MANKTTAKQTKTEVTAAEPVRKKVETPHKPVYHDETAKTKHKINS